MVQPEWEALLRLSLDRSGGRHWRSLLHLGVMRLEAGDPVGARRVWEESVELLPNGWALRNLAVLAQREKRLDDAHALYARAWDQTPAAARGAVAREVMECALAAKRPADARAFAAALPDEVKNRDRIRLLRARAALETGALDEATGLLDRGFADIREGDAGPTRLWHEIGARRLAAREGVAVDDALRARARQEFPLPRHLTFGKSDSSAAYGQ